MLRHTGTPRDGAIARRQLAAVLVRSLTSQEADHETFELVSAKGAMQDNLNPLLAALDTDPAGALDAVHDTANMPIEDEPMHVREELQAIHNSRK